MYLAGLLLVIQGLFTFRQPIAGLQGTDFYLGRIKFLHVVSLIDSVIRAVSSEFNVWYLDHGTFFAGPVNKVVDDLTRCQQGGR